MVADFGDGIKIIWTPAVDPKAVLGIPALQGVTLKPAAWVFPPGEKADQILINPAYPPDYQDAIVWFPDTDIQPIYISLSVMGGHAYHPAPKGLTAFPDVVKADAKTKVQGARCKVQGARCKVVAGFVSAGKIIKVVFMNGTVSMVLLRFTTNKESI